MTEQYLQSQNTNIESQKPLLVEPNYQNSKTIKELELKIDFLTKMIENNSSTITATEGQLLDAETRKYLDIGITIITLGVGITIGIKSYLSANIIEIITSFLSLVYAIKYAFNAKESIKNFSNYLLAIPVLTKVNETVKLAISDAEIQIKELLNNKTFELEIKNESELKPIRLEVEQIENEVKGIEIYAFEEAGRSIASEMRSKSRCRNLAR